MRRIPPGIAAGMMAGILFQFGVNAFKSATTMPALTFGMVVAYVVFRRLVPRYCIVLVLLSGVILASLVNLILQPPVLQVVISIVGVPVFAASPPTTRLARRSMRSSS